MKFSDLKIGTSFTLPSKKNSEWYVKINEEDDNWVVATNAVAENGELYFIGATEDVQVRK